MIPSYGHLTWEWKEGLRSYVYPTLFAVLYKTLAVLRLDSRIVLVIVQTRLLILYITIHTVVNKRHSHTHTHTHTHARTHARTHACHTRHTRHQTHHMHHTHHTPPHTTTHTHTASVSCWGAARHRIYQVLDSIL